jgi:predicted DNA-binding transcriptional regulator AlpA
MTAAAKFRRGAQGAESRSLGPGLMTSKELAEFLGISRWQVYAWRMKGATGGPRFIRLGKRIRYFWEDVLRFVEDRRKGGAFEEAG